MTTHLWKLMAGEVNRKAGRFQKEVLAADMARATGLSPQVISKWRNKPTQPRVEHLVAVRDRLGIPWADLLDAMLADKGYLPEPPSLTESLGKIKGSLPPTTIQDETGT